MRLFIYEFITGGGTFSVPSWGVPGGSLLAEGGAMIRALTEDFLRIPEISVLSMWDARLPMTLSPLVEAVEIHDRLQEENQFRRLASSCDATLVIAPEIDDQLLHRCERVESVGGILMNSSLEFVKLTSDKQLTIDTLQAAGIRVPRSEILNDNAHLRGRKEPVVIKPRFGAGSCDLHFLQPDDSCSKKFDTDGSLVIQSYCRGEPASIAFLCSSHQKMPLFPFSQKLGKDFSYGGGTSIDAPSIRDRICHLAGKALDALEGARGYVGVDIVIGENPDGSDDAVIEINPRLTTSYIGNRAIAEQNLADAMLRAFRDESIELKRHSKYVSFTADGHVTWC